MVNNFIKKLSGAFNKHVGNVGFEEHGSASDVAGGFMPPDLYKGSRQLFRRRSYIESGDIMELRPGYYESSHFINTPVPHDGWRMAVDIVQGYDGRKNIWAYGIAGVQVWYTTVHTDGSFKWYEVWSRPEIIFENWERTDTFIKGSSRGIMEGKNFSDYRTLKLFIHDTNLNRSYVYETPTGGNVHFNTQNLSNSDPLALNFYELEVNLNSDNTITVGNNVMCWKNLADMTVAGSTTENPLIITGIFGVR